MPNIFIWKIKKFINSKNTLHGIRVGFGPGRLDPTYNVLTNKLATTPSYKLKRKRILPGLTTTFTTALPSASRKKAHGMHTPVIGTQKFGPIWTGRRIFHDFTVYSRLQRENKEKTFSRWSSYLQFYRQLQAIDKDDEENSKCNDCENEEEGE